MTDRDIATIPARNLRVSREAFGEFWREAEAYSAAETAAGRPSWRAGGLVIACRWLACSTTDVNGQRSLAQRPIAGGMPVAYEELIEAEYVAAEVLAAKDPATRRYAERPGYVEAVQAVLRWVWRRNGPRPVVDPATAVSAAS